MFVEEIVIDGFKSYAQKVVVSDFDPHFNAITGLNGSGKSNILDSICFVLGITNLSQVRAGSLQDLIYKQGQAGVTKASVSITFDNADKATSPLGYEHCEKIVVTRQIAIGGRSKFLINGHVAQPARVQNLFHSVQLNVNNPHFLIMQGRITKVLNMKPPEILNMLEEAAGTRMFESKKEAALKTLAKKQLKVDEIDQLLAEEVVPALEKLRKEKATFAEFTRLEQTMARTQRQVVAQQYVGLHEAVHGGGSEASLLQAQANEIEATMARLRSECAAIERDLEGVAERKRAVAGRAMEAAQDAVQKTSNELIKKTSELTNAGKTLEAERKNVADVEAQIAALEAQQDPEGARAAELALRKARAELEMARSRAKVAEEKARSVQEDSGSAETVMQEEIGRAKAARSAAAAREKQGASRAAQLRKRLAAAAKRREKEAAGVAELRSAVEEGERAVADLRARGAAAAGDGGAAGALEELRGAREAEMRRARDIQDVVDKLKCSLKFLEVQYTSPAAAKKVARDKVHGMMAELLRVKDPSAALALEVAAGSKLYQLVVADEGTAKGVLAGLRQRLTVVPLSKIRGSNIPPEVLEAVEGVSGGFARPAVAMIEYDGAFEAAMAYGFGGVLVAKDAETAKKCAFDPKVRLRCVTLEGDEFSPSGLLTGGSRSNSRNVLTQLSQLREASDELAGRTARADAIARDIAALESTAREADALAQELARAEHALTLARNKLDAHTAGGAAAAEAAELEAELAALEGDTRAAAEEAAALDEQLAALAAQLQAARTGGLAKAVEKEAKETKKALAGAEKAARAAEEASVALQTQAEGAAAEAAEARAALEEARGAVAAAAARVAALEGEVAAAREAHVAATRELKAQEARVAGFEAEESGLTKGLRQRRAALEEADVALGEARGRVQRAQQARERGAKELDRLLKQHPWISTEKHMFGQPGSGYEGLGERELEAAQKELGEAEARLKTLARHMNKKVLAMFDRAEQEYRALAEKKAAVVRDRENISRVIAQLDQKKLESLHATWEKVTRDFASIFSTLLPGASARLDPFEGNVENGLEVRVGFNGAWKESLTELSGGQRSLLALSLILALLLFKPAPIYILDEVDAALDLSHTENIGRMIQTHFPYSQFIVVSLKEGMFNNANVLFRTRFADGVSSVARAAKTK
ncbi:unnamed protein product [Pedinophyceae sp. YPF-701]|nr:unnamed protein product [Pedinophyceae sp. YPF-701]